MPVTQVVAAVIYKDASRPARFGAPWGEYLLAQRPPGKAYAGYWEFPGGKVEPGETHLAALKREIAEELGIEVLAATPWLTRRHVYEHASVELHFFRVTAWRGEPRGLDGQRFEFQHPGSESVGPMLPANGPLLRAMALPTAYAITDATRLGAGRMLERLDAALAQGLRLVQIREKSLPAAALGEFCRAVLSRCRAARARVLINGDIDLAHALGADGVHLPSALMMSLAQRPEFGLVGASVHTADELSQAQRLDCDFAVLGPVLPTASHPHAVPLGWDGFTRIAALSALPVFALGGLAPEHAPLAWANGAHGLAMLSAAWR
jgi:8-oxo-dGTP diphosphatase